MDCRAGSAVHEIKITHHRFCPASQPQRSGRGALQQAHAAARLSVEEPAAKGSPYWIGKSGLVSQAINAAIANPAIWSVMRLGARKAMISTAEKAGIPWKQTVAELQACEQLDQLREQLTTPGFSHPEYADRKFHAYEDGHYDWQAVFEVEPATSSLAVRVCQDSTMGHEEASTAMRQAPVDTMQDFCQRHHVDVLEAVDVGCAAGDSTRWLANSFPSARVTGVDISAHFLALAELRRRQAEPSSATASMSYLHGSAETLPMQDSSLDLFASSYLLHELPASITQQMLQEAYRVLRPGGVIAMIDGDPRSEVYQTLPLPLATLMKSTEPYLDEYFSIDMEACMYDAGFVSIEYHPVNQRHCLMIGKKP